MQVSRVRMSETFWLALAGIIATFGGAIFGGPMAQRMCDWLVNRAQRKSSYLKQLETRLGELQEWRLAAGIREEAWAVERLELRFQLAEHQRETDAAKRELAYAKINTETLLVRAKTEADTVIQELRADILDLQRMVADYRLKLDDAIAAYVNGEKKE